MKKNKQYHVSYNFDAPTLKYECNNCGEKLEIRFPETMKELSEIGISNPLKECISFIEKHDKCKKKNNVQLLSKKK